MTVSFHHGDCREVLRTMPDKSVHCCVTSPPYFGLRCYGHPDQIGLEPTPDAFVAEMVAVFREVRRVLRDDGTAWINLGDSYATTSGGGQQVAQTNTGAGPAPRRIGAGKINGVKPKDLLGIPWRVAFALQADGWYLRQDIIWSKPNPMPESVTDRCTKAHEYIFLLSKSARYYYDADAIKEASLDPASYEPRGARNPDKREGDKFFATKVGNHANGKIYPTRNRRSVWEVATHSFSEAHFATFPPDLIEPCIKAGCPQKCCGKCGAPWVPDVERQRGPIAETFNPKNLAKIEMGLLGVKTGLCQPGWRNKPIASSQTLGFAPSCSCNADTIPGTVLDPFAGAGTTGLVADRLRRNAILIELNPEYAAMAERRIRDDAGMFFGVSSGAIPDLERA
ncbi:MAG: site-specific DNA-methyltransferase [Pseudomonadota bacterium]